MKRKLNTTLFFLFLFIGSISVLNGCSKNFQSLSYKEKTKTSIPKTVGSATKGKPESFKCLKCHKGSKSLENLVKEKGINSAEKLRYLIRKGPKSGLHVTVPDEDLEKAIQYLNLK